MLYLHGKGDRGAWHQSFLGMMWYLLFIILVSPVSVRSSGDVTTDHGAIVIDSAPPYLFSGVAPNLFLTMDDSSSMNQAFVPDDIWGDGTEQGAAPQNSIRNSSSLTNRLYYDPFVTYVPPMQSNGEPLPHAEFTAAPMDAFSAVVSCRDDCEKGRLVGSDTEFLSCAEYCAKTKCALNLAENYSAAWNLTNKPAACADREVNASLSFLAGLEPTLNGYAVDYGHAKYQEFRAAIIAEKPLLSDSEPTIGSAWASRCMGIGNAADCPAYYYRYYQGAYYTHPENGNLPCSGVYKEMPAAQDFPTACLERVLVGTPTDYQKIYDSMGANDYVRVTNERAARLLKAGEARNDAVLAKRNFANWYSYYRTRFLAVQTALSRSMAGLPARVRLGYQDLSQDSSNSKDYLPGSAGYNRLALSFAPFDQDARRTFFDWLYSNRATGNTYLINAALRVHELCSSVQVYAQDPVGKQVSTNNQLWY